jgi:HEAT repeat protein
MRRQLLFILFFAMLTLSNVDSSAGRSGGPNKGFVRQCVSDDELANAVVSLSRDYPEAQVAQRLLRQSAKRSSACRRQVVAAVMGAMNKPNLDIKWDQASANLWREGAVLLGDLKATESLDLLLAHIKMTDGEFSLTMTHQPALAGIIRMGTLAIPKLKPLLQSKDWETRHYAVYCLFWIGGTLARRELERALPTETDRCVKKFMSVSLKTMREAKETTSGTSDQSEWVKSFLCWSWVNR